MVTNGLGRSLVAQPRMISQTVGRVVLCGLALAWFAIASVVRGQDDLGPFAAATALPEGRQMHGAAVLGGYLYAVGGVVSPGGFTTSVVASVIDVEGSLGAWRPTTPLPANRHYIGQSTVALDDVLYVVGGKNGASGRYYNDVLWTRPGAGGQLEPWKTSRPFGESGLSFVVVVTTPGMLHLIGGYDQSAPVASVTTGLTAPGGGIVAWEAGPPLPKPLWQHNAAVAGGRVWVWGGLSQSAYSPISSAVYSAPVLGTGRLGAWREEPSAAGPGGGGIFGGASTAAGSYLLTFCPRLGENVYTGEVLYGLQDGSGVIGWNRVKTSLPNQVYSAVATDYRRGAVYLLGGKRDRSSSQPADPRVFVARLAMDSGSGGSAGDGGGKVATAPPSSSGSGSVGMIASAARPTLVASGSPRVDADLTPGGGSAEGSYAFQAQSRLAQGAAPGFLPYDQGRRLAAGPPGRPLVLYFHSPMSRLCAEQTRLFLEPSWKALQQRAVFCWIDLRESPQLAQQLGVTKTPTWVFYDAGGKLSDRTEGAVLSSTSLVAQVALLSADGE